MVRQRSARFRSSIDNVDDAWWDASFEADPAEFHSTQRCLLGHLQYHGVARRQSRSQLDAGVEKRVVPRHDSSDYAIRFSKGVVEERLLGRKDLSSDLVRRTGVVIEDASAKWQVAVLVVLERLATVQRIKQGEFVAATLNDFGHTLEQLAPFPRRHAGPGSFIESTPRTAHGTINILRPALGNFRQRLFGGRVEGDELLPSHRVHFFSINNMS